MVGSLQTISSCVVLSYPKSRVAVEAPIGSSTPITMSPTSVYNFVVENQNSISPYRRTLKKLKAIGNRPNIVIQTAGPICDFGIQNVMELAIATNFPGKLKMYLDVSLVLCSKQFYVSQ